VVAGKGTKTGSADLTVAILRGIGDEIVGLRKDTDAMRIDLKAEIAGPRTELKAEIAGLRAETGQLRQGLEDLETVTIQGFRGVATRLEAIQDVTSKQ
jgi:hypothetical protein